MKINFDEAKEELTIILELKNVPARWHPRWLLIAARVLWALARG